MLTDDQRAKLHDAISAYGQTVHDGMPGPVGEARLAIIGLVSGWLDHLRPRDPKVELPTDGQEVVYETLRGFRSMGLFEAWTDEEKEFGDGSMATFPPDAIRYW